MLNFLEHGLIRIVPAFVKVLKLVICRFNTSEAIYFHIQIV